MVTGSQLGWVARGVSRREVGWRQVPGGMEGASDPQPLCLASTSPDPHASI